VIQPNAVTVTNSDCACQDGSFLPLASPAAALSRAYWPAADCGNCPSFAHGSLRDRNFRYAEV